jgi:hypothetical protein
MQQYTHTYIVAKAQHYCHHAQFSIKKACLPESIRIQKFGNSMHDFRLLP